MKFRIPNIDPNNDYFKNGLLNNLPINLCKYTFENISLLKLGNEGLKCEFSLDYTSMQIKLTWILIIYFS